MRLEWWSGALPLTGGALVLGAAPACLLLPALWQVLVFPVLAVLGAGLVICGWLVLPQFATRCEEQALRLEREHQVLHPGGSPGGEER